MKNFFVITLFFICQLNSFCQYKNLFFEIEVNSIFHLQNTKSENQKIKGGAIPNYQLGFNVINPFHKKFGISYSIFATSFGNKVKGFPVVDGNQLEIGTGPNRQTGNAYYSFFTNIFLNNSDNSGIITTYLGAGISINQIQGVYDISETFAYNPNSGSSTGLQYKAERVSLTGYYFHFASEIRVLKIKKVNSINLKTGFVIGMKNFNKLEVKLFENYILADKATVTSNGTGIYFGLTYKMLKGRKNLEKLNPDLL